MAETKRLNVLVTGATGQVGFATVSELLKRFPNELNVIAAVRDLKRTEKLRALDSSLTIREINTNSLQKVFEGVDVAFIIAPSSLDKAEVVTALAAAAKQAGVKHIVALSVLVADIESLIFGKLLTGSNILSRKILVFRSRFCAQRCS